MEILIIILVLVVILGIISLLFFVLDGLPIVEPLEKLIYIAEMGVVLAPCLIMSTDEFGEPYTLQTWAITIGLMLGCLLLTVFLRICIDSIEENANRRQMKKQKKHKQKAVKNLLGRSAVKKFKGKELIESAKDTNTNSKSNEKPKLRETLALHLARAQGATFASALAAPILIAINGGIGKVFDPLCILTVLLGIGLSLVCGWISKKIFPEI